MTSLQLLTTDPLSFWGDMTMTQAAMRNLSDEFVAAVTEHRSWRGYKDVIGLGTAELEQLYSLAYALADQDKLDQAENLLRFLTMCAPRQPRFWLALGGVLQRGKDYENAIIAFSMLPELDDRNPRAPLLAAECYMALGLFEEALSGIDTAVAWNEEGHNDEALMRHAQALYLAFDRLETTAD